MDKIEKIIFIIRESLEDKLDSLPDTPHDLFKKIKISFPNFAKTIGLMDAAIIHENIIKFKCKNLNLYVQRSQDDYKKVNVAAKRGSEYLFKEKNVFFEDLERVVKTKLRLHIKEDKIGTGTKELETLATTLGGAVKSTEKDERMTDDIVKGVAEKYDDFDSAIKSGRFKKKLKDIDPDAEKKIKKSNSKLN